MTQANANMVVKTTTYYCVLAGKALIPGRSNEEENFF